MHITLSNPLELSYSFQIYTTTPHCVRQSFEIGTGWDAIYCPQHLYASGDASNRNLYLIQYICYIAAGLQYCGHGGENGCRSGFYCLVEWLVLFSFPVEYICHDSGAAAVAYSPNRQCIVSGGRKGDICILPTPCQIGNRFVIVK